MTSNIEVVLSADEVDTIYNHLEKAEIASWNSYVLVGIAILITAKVVKNTFW